MFARAKTALISAIVIASLALPAIAQAGIKV
jgi:hypothetical protein